MYTTTHTAIGISTVVLTHELIRDILPSTTAIVTACIIGGITSFILHDSIDRLGQHKYYNKLSYILFEILPLIIFSYLAVITDNKALYLLGFITANGMDLIDKKLYLSKIFKSINQTRYFKCHRRRRDYYLTLNQTKLAAVLSTILVVGLNLLTN